MRFLIIYFLVQISFFVTVLEHFSLCNFKIFRRRPIMVADIFAKLPSRHKKASYGFRWPSIELNDNVQNGNTK